MSHHREVGLVAIKSLPTKATESIHANYFNTADIELVMITDSVFYIAGPTLKVRRPFVLKKYEVTIGTMYNESRVTQV